MTHLFIEELTEPDWEDLLEPRVRGLSCLRYISSHIVCLRKRGHLGAHVSFQKSWFEYKNKNRLQGALQTIYK